MTASGLSAVADADLRALIAAIDRGDLGAPFSAAGLQSRGLGHILGPLGPFLALDAPGLRAVADVVLAERRNRPGPTLTLVWTGDDPGISHSRHTRVFLPELFARAREHVLIAGYSFDHGADTFPALHQAMVDHSVSAELFVDANQLVERLKQAARAGGRDWGLLATPMNRAQSPIERGRAAVALFYTLMWPFGDPRPKVFFDPRTAERASIVSLHAKCVVVDHHYTLITSANFTNRGQKRNIEAGVAIDDRTLATSLERQWRNLVDAGVVTS